MAGEVRARMVEGAVRLLAQRGLQATSFSEILELTGAPRGSVYHHFPDGKDQLIAEALDLAGSRALALLDQWAGASPEQITDNFLRLWRAVLVQGKLQVGCAVVAVTVATDSPELLEHAATAFRTWRRRLTELFAESGVPASEAARFAALLVASSEGAVVISRAEQSLEPFELVCEHLLDQARKMLA